MIELIRTRLAKIWQGWIDLKVIWSDIDELGQCPRIDLRMIKCVWNGLELIKTDWYWFRKVWHDLGSTRIGLGTFRISLGMFN